MSVTVKIARKSLKDYAPISSYVDMYDIYLRASIAKALKMSVSVCLA